MSKNLTRKGYALGALVALASSLFAGSPALAADSVVLAADSTDTTLAAPINEALTLNASLAPGSTAANIAQLKYQIVTDGTFTVKAVSKSGADATSDVFTRTAGTTGAVAGTFNATTGDAKKTTIVVPRTPDVTKKNTLIVSIDAVPDTTPANGRAPISTDSTRSVDVTAFIDANNNNVFDSGEAFQTQTVKFIKYSEITSETTITGPVVATGAAVSIVAKTKFTNVNNAQLAGAVTVNYNTGVATSGGWTSGSLTWSATDLFKSDSTTNYTPVEGDIVKVQALLAGVKVGTPGTLAITAASVDLLTGDVVRSTTARVTTAGSAGEASLNTEFSVKWGASLSTLTTTSKVVASVPVTVTVTSSKALSSTVTLTVNGTTYTSATALAAATISATTDAKGVATVKVSSAGLADLDTLTFVAKAAGKTAANLVVTQKAQTYSAYYLNSPTGNFTTTDGGAVSVQVAVKDQFGGLPADATYDVSLSLKTSGSTQTTAATSASNTYAAVTAGKATLSVLDNGTGAGVNTYRLDLSKKATNGQYSSTVDQAKDAVINIVKDVTAAKIALSAATALKATSSTDATLAFAATDRGSADLKANLSVTDFAAYNGFNVEEVDGSDTITTNFATFTGVVKTVESSTVAATNLANAEVKISGTGMQFDALQNGTKVVGVDSLTIYANASGSFTVNVNSHLAGKQTVTITSGAVTTKLYVNFASADAANATTVTAVVADGAAQFQAGRALDVTFKVTDKYGNVIATPATGLGSLTIAQTGAGYLLNSGVVQTAAATGSYGTKLITNFGDLGTSTITATLDLTTDVVRTVSSEFGVTDADVTVGGRAVYASVEFAKGKTVTVSVDGKRLYSKLFTTDAYTELKFTQRKAGKHTVTVRVSGGIVYSEVVTTSAR